ncbi:MAG: hypothetical protein LAT67_11860 [Balneolales bacterium]|nr:hypothetical protein [Balneolales bacterium]
MDLASGAKRLIITMPHTNKDGSPKIVAKCTLLLTARSVVDVIITELAFFRFEHGRLILAEMMPGSDLEEVKSKTGASFELDKAFGNV